MLIIAGREYRAGIPGRKKVMYCVFERKNP
jgi:hypothetical protein